MFRKEIKIRSVNLFTRIRNNSWSKKPVVLLAGLLVSMAAIAQTPPPTLVETDTLAPFVSSVAVTVFSTSSATMGGNVTGNGGVAVTEYGVVFSSSNAVPTLVDSKVVIGSGNGAFSQSVSGLAGGTTYFVRAYATNLIGTSYGAVMSFTTSPTNATVTTSEASLIGNTTATLGGNVTLSGGVTVTERGIVYSSTNGTPTVADTKVQVGTGTGAFTQAVSGLTLAATYYVRSYAINSIGTSYGAVVSFVPGGASVSTDVVSGVSSNGVTAGGNVISIGGSAVTDKGFVYVAGNGVPTLTNTKVFVGAGIGAFTQAITSLQPGTLYSLRAYASNSTGTNYGALQTFTTQGTLSSINRTGATTLTNSILVNYTVVFGQSVTGLTAANFSLTTTGLTNSVITGVNGSGTTWNVSVYAGVGAGPLTLNLANSTNISPALSATLPFAGQSYTIDRIVPTVSVASIVSSNTVTTAAKIGDVVTLSFTTSETLSATPVVTLAGRAVTITSTGVNSWSVSAAMTPTDTEGPVAFTIDGVDIAGNIGVTGTTSTNGTVVVFDKTAPVVSSINRVTASPSTTTAVQYTVAFSEAGVTGVDASDFTLNTTNSLSGASISSVTGSGAVYIVTVNTTAGSGFLRLDLKATGTGIADLAGNPIATGFTAGQTYEIQRKPIVKTTPPNSVCTPNTANLASPVVTAGSDTLLVYRYYASATATTSLTTPGAVGAGTYYITGTNSSGIASDPVPVTVTVETGTPAIRMAPVNVNINEPAPLQARTFGIAYLWAPSAGLLSDPKISNPYVITTQERQFTINITAPSGCVTVDTLLVRIYDKKAYVPNVFSPNGDGINDVLFPSLIGVKQLFFFRVYNRYGKLVFETSNMANGWNGRMNGSGDILPGDTYVWTIKGIGVRGDEVNEQGTTTLLR